LKSTVIIDCDLSICPSLVLPLRSDFRLVREPAPLMLSS
jgi:hypothetical protein